MTDDVPFSAWLKQRRKVLDLTQRDLALRAHCSLSTIRKLEAAVLRPSRAVTEHLADLLEIRPTERAAFLAAARAAHPSSSTHPAPATTHNPTNLPTPPTALIGREAEVVVIRRLLARPHVRLVTLTGAGGTGKTRLAVEVAAVVRDAFADDVWFVSLAPIGDATLVASTIAHALHLQEVVGRPLVETLQAHLRRRRLLLVLDNFEHVLAAAPLVAQLLTVAPRLVVLVTSRAPLHLSGEQEFPVPPLALPDLQQPLALEAVAQAEAVALFVQRAQAVRPDFQLTAENAPAVAQICVQLDGLPLAIELAAARSKVLPPEALMQRLGSQGARRLNLLTGGAHDLPARQQTLRRTLDWSYHLLDGDLQILFRRLSVFVGGWSLEAAEAVCAKEGLVCDTLEGLQALLDQSLILPAHGVGGEPRFMLLETIRAYAWERLVACGEIDAAQRRHAEYYLEMAEATAPMLAGSEQGPWLDKLERDIGNLRAALTWSATGPRTTEMGLALAGALWWFWDQRSHQSEGRVWLAHLLACSRDQPPTLARIRALNAAGYLAYFQQDLPVASTVFEESVDMGRRLGDTQGLAYALMGRANVAMFTGDSVQAEALHDQSLRQFQGGGNQWGLGWLLNGRATLAIITGDAERATRLLEESLVVFRSAGSTTGMARCLYQLGRLAQGRGDDQQALALYEQTLALWQAIGNTREASWTRIHLGELVQRQGDDVRASVLHQESLATFRASADKAETANALFYLGEAALVRHDRTQATAWLEEALTLYQEFGLHEGIVWTLLSLGRAAHAQDGVEQAMTRYRACLELKQTVGNARLFAHVLMAIVARQGEQAHGVDVARLGGAAESILGDSTAISLPQGEREAYKHALAAARRRLDEEVWALAWTEGRAMTREQALAAALEQTTSGAHAPVTDRVAPPAPALPAIPTSTRQALPRELSAHVPELLTAREREVLHLVARGLTNVQVADTLVISPRTVEKHLAAIYRKLEVSSRTAATRYATDHDLV